jgi:hypothetical protein
MRGGGRASRLLKKGVRGVASAPPQPLAVAGLLLATLFKRRVSLREFFLASRLAKGQTRHPHPFFSSLLQTIVRETIVQETTGDA